jgi:hypothetical protein
LSNEHFLAADYGFALRAGHSLLCDPQAIVAGKLLAGSTGVKRIAQRTTNLTETAAFEQLMVDKQVAKEGVAAAAVDGVF